MNSHYWCATNNWIVFSTSLIETIAVLHYAPETFKMWSWGLTLLKFDHFTATQILREIKFWWIHTVPRCYFCQFQRIWILILVYLGSFQVLNLPKFKFQSFQNCQKWHFWTVWICQNCSSRKIGAVVKWSNCNKVKP